MPNLWLIFANLQTSIACRLIFIDKKMQVILFLASEPLCPPPSPYTYPPDGPHSAIGSAISNYCYDSKFWVDLANLLASIACWILTGLFFLLEKLKYT